MEAFALEAVVERLTVRLERVTAAAVALELIGELELEHGPLMFHLSGGCCDGSSPMCYPRGEFRVGSRDVHLGDVGDTPFYLSGPQFAYWKHTHLTVDVVPGRGSGFSVEAPRGVRFLIRSRLFTDQESAQLELEGNPPTGPAETAAATCVRRASARPNFGPEPPGVRGILTRGFIGAVTRGR